MSHKASLCTKLAVTRAERVRLQLAAEILTGTFEPGTRLDEVTQSSRMGVSRTPLREAVRQLATLGLVENRPHRGVVVADRVGESLFETLSELEATCASLATERMPAPERADLLRLVQEGGNWLDAMHRGCANTVLVGLVETLWQPVTAADTPQPRALMPEMTRALGRRVATAIANGCRTDAETAMRDYVRAAAAAFNAPAMQVV